MKQLYQNRKELNINIQYEGCYFIDLLNIWQEVSGHELLYEVVNAIYILSTRTKNYAGKPYLEKDCYVNDISGVAKIASDITCKKVAMRQVREYEKHSHVIGYFERVTNSGNIVGHFVELFLDRDDVKRDPWYPSSRTAREGILKSKRFILAEVV